MSDDILIDANGDISFVYSDELAEVFAGERLETTRASHVEPHPTKPGWLADMRPSGGPVLGSGCEEPGQPQYYKGRVGPETLPYCTLYDVPALTPFTSRQAALEAERAWLRAHKDL